MIQSETGNRILAHISCSIPVLLAVFLFFNPMPHTTAIKEICFYTAAAFTAILVAAKNLKLHLSNPFTLPLGLLLAWVVLDAFFALNKPNTIHDIYAHLIKYYVFFFLIANFFDTRARLDKLIWIMVASAGVFAVGAAYYFYFTLANPITARFGPRAFTELPTNVIPVVTIPAAVFSIHFFARREAWWNKFIFAAAFITVSSATILTQARSGFAALSVAMMMLFPRNKRFMLILLPLILVLVFLTPLKSKLHSDAIQEKFKSDVRIKIFYTFVEMAKDYPLTGIGFGLQTYADDRLLSKYNERVPAKYRQPFLHEAPHNLIVDILVRLGVIGLALYFYLFFVFCKVNLNIVRAGKGEDLSSLALCTLASFSAFFIIAMFENLAGGVPAIVMYLLFAVTTIIWKLNEAEGSARRCSQS